jgi:hypothetical protein
MSRSIYFSMNYSLINGFLFGIENGKIRNLFCALKEKNQASAFAT